MEGKIESAKLTELGGKNWVAAVIKCDAIFQLSAGDQLLVSFRSGTIHSERAYVDAEHVLIGDPGSTVYVRLPARLLDLVSKDLTVAIARVDPE
jgi:hypothetical protein